MKTRMRLDSFFKLSELKHRTNHQFVTLQHIFLKQNRKKNRRITDSTEQRISYFLAC